MTIKLPILTELELEPIVSIVTVLRMPELEIPKLISQCHLSRSDANIYMNQYQIFTIMGCDEFAIEMQNKALEHSLIYRVESKNIPNIRLLAFMCSGEAALNTPLEYLIENTNIRLDIIYILEDKPLPDTIPDHDVAIIAICASKKTKPLLDQISKFISHWPRPVLNHPNLINHCYRDTLYHLLKFIPKVKIPSTAKVTREELMRVIKLELHISSLLGNGDYPITIRPIDFHGGNEFSKIDTQGKLSDYLIATNKDEFYISYYINYCSNDGYFRKARIALIDGHPYICHLAISNHWIVHYKTSGMNESLSKRQEEASFMENFDSDFAARHCNALTSISNRLELDYVIIDCAETPNGELLIFEIDNYCWVHATDPEDVFPYKQNHMNKVFSAFQSMLIKKKALRLK